MSNTTRRRSFSLVAIALLSLALLAGARPAPAEATMTDAEQRVLDLLNEERASHGLGPLVATATLDAAAAWLAADLSTIDGLDHTDTLGRELRERLSAFDYPANSTIRENIAAGYATPEAVVTGWMESPGHRTNMLASEARAVGIALYEEPGTTFRYFWVINFGSVVDAPPPAATAAAPLLPASSVALTGDLPTDGVGLMVVQEPAAPAEIVASVAAGGCEESSVWVTISGSLVGYLPGAPAFVNNAFPDSLPAGTPFVVTCG